MKTKSFFTLLVAVVLCFYGCSENCDCSSNNSDDSEDICEFISDDYFRQYCHSNFDTNYDGKVSQDEADAVKQIILNSGMGSRYGSLEVDFSGIEYFRNLEYFESNLVGGSLDLSQNTQVSYIHMPQSTVREIDLRNTKLTSIDYNAFYGCSSLRTVEFPDVLKSIDNYAFFNCNGMQTIEFPESLTTIRDYAFDGSYSLENVTVKASLPPHLYSQRPFSVRNTAVLYVPSGSEEAYASSNWGTYFTNITAIEE